MGILALRVLCPFSVGLTKYLRLGTLDRKDSGIYLAHSSVWALVRGTWLHHSITEEQKGEREKIAVYRRDHLVRTRNQSNLGTRLTLS